MESYCKSPVGNLWRCFCATLAAGACLLAPAVADADGYERFESNPAVFTWTGSESTFANGRFVGFDARSGVVLPDTFLGTNGYRTVAGWSGSFVPKFWWVYAARFDGTNVPYSVGSGYVLRFAPGESSGLTIATPQALALGGLIVESGATGYGLGGSGVNAAKLTIGADDTSSVNCLDIRESFVVSGTIDRLLGEVELSIAGGKALSVTSLAVPAATDSPSVPPMLKFVGEGTLTGKVTAANCAVLDFSAQTNRALPMLSGALTLGAMTRLVLPAAVEASVPYQLCGGALTASAGLYAIAKGEGDFFLADLAFDSGKVTYAEAEVNRAEVDADVAWSGLAWQGGAFVPGKPVVLSLTRDAVITVDEDSLVLPALLVSGGRRLSFVNRRGAVLTKVFAGRGSRFELVIDGASAGFSKALSVPAGLPYVTVLQGSSDASAPTNWVSGAISVSGRLATRGWLSIGSSLMSTLMAGSVLAVESGRLNVKGSGTWTGATLDLGGELAFGSGLWSAKAGGAGTAILFRDGGALVGDGFASATLDVKCPTLMRAYSGAEARLAAGLTTSTNVVAMRLEGGSTLAVTETIGRSVVEIERLVGTGALLIHPTNNVSGAAYRLRDVSAFDGRLEVSETRASVLLGKADLTAESAIVVPDDYELDSNRDWSATVARFGATLKVAGLPTDSLFRMTGYDDGYRSVRVLLTKPDGRMQACALGFDSTSRHLYFVAVPEPPQFDVSDVSFSFGTDFTNGTVTVDIRNYREGSDFEGAVNAEYYVYDVNGRLVGYGSRNLSGNGTHTLGEVALLGGQGGGYRCEVIVKAVNTLTGEETMLYDNALAKVGAHWEGNWFHEDATTFPASSGAPTEYGRWTYEKDAVTRDDDCLEINTTSSNGYGQVCFLPFEDRRDELVRIRTRMRIDGAWDSTNELAAADAAGSRRLAGLTLISDNDEDFSYAVWLPQEGRFERVFGNSPADASADADVEVLLNYRTGHIGYSVNGAALTNAAGKSYFPMTDAIASADDKFVAYRGCGALMSLDGDCHNSTLAAVVKDGVTNEYASVDEAVAAAKAGGGGVQLLWDASWRPVGALGETFAIDRNGHKLTIDGSAVRSGYRVVDRGDGTYVIDVVTYELRFAGNGADEGEMAPQLFSVTNAVLDLLPNEFVRTNFDFAAWNQAADGSGPTNWSDRARIDLAPYGYSNMTLYAQWRIAVRTIVIEPADEFVYVESVQTNGAVSLGARFFQADAAKGTGRVEIPVESGSDVVIRFSSDIERQLTFNRLDLTNVMTSVTLPYADLPKLYSPLPPLPDDQLAWALRHGIPLEDVAASPFAQASCDLDIDHLLTNESTISFTAFTALSDGCAFTLLVDGQPLPETAKIASMVRVLRNYAEGWKTPAPEAVTVGAGGRVEVKTGEPMSLFKIVIP